MAGEDSREVSLAETQAKLAELEVAYAGASGADTLKTLKRIVREQNNLNKTEDRIYAKPWTLPMQIFRSILCVFAGFIVGVAIAVPIGVCCGLSRTFMAAMTPFIALFKPVSPIVWLLIFMIVVGGFFPDPDKSIVLDGLTDFTNWITGLIPFVGNMVNDFDINIAFIASALTVSMCSLWATMVNTALGVASVDKDHINVAKVLRLGFFSRLFKIVLPSALPLVFAGMRISLGVGWMVLIAAELLASSEGLGKFTWDQFNNGATDSFAKIVCMVFVVGIIGLLLDRIMIIFQRLVSFEGSVATI
ncbi:MAG: ABC transporter permease subunit [Planctomycetota bacterium]